MAYITELYTYPLKSGKEIALNAQEFSINGFSKDRLFSIVNTSGEVITARENPRVLEISCDLDEEEIMLSYKGAEITFNRAKSESKLIQIKLFKKYVDGYTISSVLNQWLTVVLEEEVKIISSIQLGKPNTVALPYMDDSPFNLVNEASIADLNRKLIKPVNSRHFRSNIVVSGVDAYEEDSWKKIKIGNTLFEVVSKCPRCTMMTVTYDDHTKDNELLKFLSENRKEGNNVNFGVYLKPLSRGMLKEGDVLEVLEKWG